MEWKQYDFYTNPIFRFYCGCDKFYFDESISEWVAIEAHGPMCHRRRFPVDADYSDRTLKRRSWRIELLGSNVEVQTREEKLYSGEPKD
jgi:hypothetical protein